MKKVWLLILCLMVTGCGTKEMQIEKNVTGQKRVFAKNQEVIKESEPPKISSFKEDSSSPNALVTSSEETIINYFENKKGEVETIINSSSLASAKEKAKNIFFDIIDFIFFDKQINGVTFSSLSLEAKAKVMTIALNIDSTIMKKYPNYKENVSTAYQSVIETLKEDLANTKNKLEEIIGEEKYAKLEDTNEKVKEGAANLLEKAKDFTSEKLADLKEWYLSKRNSIDE